MITRLVGLLRTYRVALVAAALLVISSTATGWYVVAVRPYQAPGEMTGSPREALDTLDTSLRDTQIRVWGVALAADTGSALVLGQLAALHAQRARETGAFDDYLTAEQFARRSLDRRTQRNGATAVTLVSALLAQHRFADAMTVADSLVQREPDIPVYQAVRAEVAMELGRYDDARAAFTRLRPYRTQLSIAPRIARWLELTGHALEARALLDSAEAQLASRRDTPRETQAWFALRLGDLEWRRGHPRSAAAHYREGLAARPNDPRLLTAMSRLAARMQRGDDAKRWAERAIAAQADVNTLLVLAQAQEVAGDSAGARTTANAVATLASSQAGPPHREWLLWQIDHGEQLPQIIERASHDVVQRPDVYGYDLLGWALYRDNRPQEARTMLKKAQLLGTRDPLIAAHAEVIGHE